jgi:hypothetical protein
MSDPLTPAQVEALEEMLEEREERLKADVQAMIDHAVADTIRYGDRVGFRMHAGQVMCAEQGGPTVAGEPVQITSRPSVGVWESFTTERGQG